MADTAVMEAVTIRDAKARLNALVEAAERGEQVVLMRGSRVVAAIVPVSASELELAPRLSDPQAERLWQSLAAERRGGARVVFDSPEQAVAHLAGPPRPAGRRRQRPTRPTRARRSR